MITAQQHQAAVSQARHDGASQVRAQARDQGMKAGAEAERARIFAVLNHEAAKGHKETAKKMLMSTSMSPQDIIAILATLPRMGVPTRNREETLRQMGATAQVMPQELGAASASHDGSRAFEAAAARAGLTLKEPE